MGRGLRSPHQSEHLLLPPRVTVRRFAFHCNGVQRLRGRREGSWAGWPSRPTGQPSVDLGRDARPAEPSRAAGRRRRAVLLGPACLAMPAATAPCPPQPPAAPPVRRGRPAHIAEITPPSSVYSEEIGFDLARGLEGHMPARLKI